MLALFLTRSLRDAQHVYLALGLMALAPTAWLLQEAGLVSVTALGPWARAAVANSYYAAQAVAVARVFFGLCL